MFPLTRVSFWDRFFEPYPYQGRQLLAAAGRLRQPAAQVSGPLLRDALHEAGAGGLLEVCLDIAVLKTVLGSHFGW